MVDQKTKFETVVADWIFAFLLAFCFLLVCAIDDGQEDQTISDSRLRQLAASQREAQIINQKHLAYLQRKENADRLLSIDRIKQK